MENKHRLKYFSIVLCILLIVSIGNVCLPQKFCTVPPEPVTVIENGTVGVLVATVNTTEKDVLLALTENPQDAFELKGFELILRKALDFEALISENLLTVRIRCIKTGLKPVTLPIIVHVVDINDNPPTFSRSEFVFDVDENKYFRLQTDNYPNILIQKLVDYDVVQKMTMLLYVQDTSFQAASSKPSFTATATITINVRDIDNRPPWFQPCTKTTVGMAKICYNLGYRARVNLTEKQEGPLILQPGPLFARDGDKNRNDHISYKILRGNEDSIFQIDEKTGNITMTKAADIAGPMTLTILAFQVSNLDQFAITSVIIEVMKKSRNPPRFERERYEGYIYSNSGPDSMVLRDRTSNRPLRVKARDEDFANGVNPDIRYEVQYSSYVNVTTDGFILLKKTVRTDSFALQLRAVDVATGESGTTALSVQVLPVVGIQAPAEGYRAGDLALLGFVMAALLVLCLIVIGFLISRLKKVNTSTFKCFSPCLEFPQPTRQPRDSMQFTNDGFQNEAEASRGGARHVPDRDCRLDLVHVVPRSRAVIWERPRHCSSCGHRLLTNHSLTSNPAVHAMSSKNTEKKRSILIKEKRRDDRQKSVWFKEKEEDSSEVHVDIIPATMDIMLENGQDEGTQGSLSVPRESHMDLGDLTEMLTQGRLSQQTGDGKGNTDE
ncbi:cadherin-related family member 5 isoform X2 [Denticeps clupeoides]|uniref:cadherin-related family member 5 isoform X2 n=1 Tax=Denticeps clupeoides TaxID=299321 RepID=UPI0010A33DA2|nr:cadherin-related family member 5-like isoform X2 [Denticeps clupeoides]